MNFSDVIAKALEIGVCKVWQERILSIYLRGEIDRKEAVKLVGLKPKFIFKEMLY